MCADGVAPRAKMNQQRSRRFRAADERRSNQQIEAQLREELKKKGQPLPPKKPISWDHNVITPGTPFMAKLSDAIRFYIQDRLSTEPSWQNVRCHRESYLITHSVAHVAA
jgi:5'-3' exoribonuclease 2